VKKLENKISTGRFAVPFLLLLLLLVTSVKMLAAQEMLVSTNPPKVLTSNVVVDQTAVDVPFRIDADGIILLQVLVPLDNAVLELVDGQNNVVLDATSNNVVFTASETLGASGVPGGYFL
jgi:hypothetical protein